MKTRAELVEGLSRLQMERLESWHLFLTDKARDEFRAKRYWHYHDKNAKLSTLKLKNRIAKEVYWKVRSDRV